MCIVRGGPGNDQLFGNSINFAMPARKLMIADLFAAHLDTLVNPHQMRRRIKAGLQTRGVNARPLFVVLSVPRFDCARAFDKGSEVHSIRGDEHHPREFFALAGKLPGEL